MHPMFHHIRHFRFQPPALIQGIEGLLHRLRTHLVPGANSRCRFAPGPGAYIILFTIGSPTRNIRGFLERVRGFPSRGFMHGAMIYIRYLL